MNKKIILLIGILMIITITGIVIWFTHKKKVIDYPHKEKDPTSYDEKSFNLKLIKTVNSTQEGNYLVSPYSIEVALNMLKEGSNNESLEEINEVLPKREINIGTAKDRIGIANALFLKDTYNQYVEKNFIQTLNNEYKAEVIVDKFKTPDKINKWVKDKTYGMIEKILNNISEDFALGLANAIAIDVEWKTPFNCEATKEGEFTKANKETVKVEMMHQYVEEYAEYFQTKNAKGIILPYKKYDSNGEVNYQEGTQLEFVGILPNEDAFGYIEHLTEEELKEIDENTESVNSDLNVRLSLPRFRYKFDLVKFKEILMSLGIKSVFDEDNADFSRIVTKENLEKMNVPNLYVGTAIHKTYIDLSESGTKAAAVTFFGLNETTAMRKEPRIISLDFNRSFVYMIRDSETKEILFFGVVDEPNKWEKSTCK